LRIDGLNARLARLRSACAPRAVRFALGWDLIRDDRENEPWKSQFACGFPRGGEA
jgi:hypothetical protein